MNSRDYRRQPRRHDDPYRTTREEMPSQPRAHGHGGHGDYSHSLVLFDHIHSGKLLLTQRPQAPSWGNDSGYLNHHDHDRYPRGHGNPDRAMRDRGFGPEVDEDREEPPPWFDHREVRQWERDRGKRR